KALENARGSQRAMILGRLVTLDLAEGRFGKALEECRRGLELAEQAGELPGQCTFLSAQARLLELTGYPGEALKRLAEMSNRAVRADDLGWQRRALWQKGLVQVRMNSLSQAQRTADELKDFIGKGLNKRAIRFYDSLQGRIELGKKNYGQAIEYFRKALSEADAQSSGSFDAIDLEPLGTAYLLTDDLDNARKAFEAIGSLTSGRLSAGDIYALSFYRLGLIAEKLGDKAGARRNYEKFLELWKDADPSLPEPADARKRLAAL
ncbi:MAG: tetratricopeptide repeat protein, partial [Candidatus Aminicenantes bacterium]|nr:tetratricopeptide repeat protein [Candidatus Aminicenantes bacterium]